MSPNLFSLRQKLPLQQPTVKLTLTLTLNLLLVKGSKCLNLREHLMLDNKIGQAGGSLGPGTTQTDRLCTLFCYGFAQVFSSFLFTLFYYMYQYITSCCNKTVWPSNTDDLLSKILMNPLDTHFWTNSM